MQRSKRGVYVERSMGDTILIVAVASTGDVLVEMRVLPVVYDHRMIEGLKKWLDRADPQLRIVRS